jgi:hypothetical protein
MQRQQHPSDEIDVVEEAMTKAKSKKLEPEVVLWALYWMRKDPSLSVKECLRLALTEWSLA